MSAKNCRCLLDIIKNNGTLSQKDMTACIQTCTNSIDCTPTQNSNFAIMVPEGIMKCKYASKTTDTGTMLEGKCTFEVHISKTDV
jgi:hypothetical protein